MYIRPSPITLMQARAQLGLRLDEGMHCQNCGQWAQRYRRSINSGMARSIIAMYTVGGRDWVHVPSILNARSREEGKLAYWGLIEEELIVRDDGGRAGWWRLTEKGERYVLNELKVPHKAVVYNGRVQGFEGELKSITDALGEKFNYAELMGFDAKSGVE